MKKIIKSITELDGKKLYYSFLAGANNVFENQDIINKINVFPVADADTGTNLASTMRTIVDTPIPTTDIRATASALADAALIGARGNSGIIFAQFIYGFSNELQKFETISIKTFAEIIKNSVSYAYEAIANPVEGTMITVIKAWADCIYFIKDKIADFIELFHQAYLKALESLQQTKNQLKQLTKANVVDAGAKGFVVFLEGMLDFLKTGKVRSIIATKQNIIIDDNIHISHDEITYRYCTEALISLNKNLKATVPQIKEAITSKGDSIVVASSAEKARIHIHTDNPIDLIKTIVQFGSISYQKVDDMIFQNNIVLKKRTNIAIVTDSTCDIPQSIIEKYQIHVVPLSVHTGDSYYLDNLTINTDEFYRNLETFNNYPTTTQPAYKDFINKYSYLSTHYNKIVGLHISNKFSGTWSTSRKASHVVSEQSGKPIKVFNSKRLSSSLGLMVIRLAKEIEQNACFDELEAKIENWSINTKMFVASKTLKYMIKSGRVSYSKGLIGSLLKVKPIVILNDDGVAETFGKPFTIEKSYKQIINEITKLIKQKNVWGYSISHIKNEDGAEFFKTKLKELTGLEPEFINTASPVLGTHTGPGTIAVSVMFED